MKFLFSDQATVIEHSGYILSFQGKRTEVKVLYISIYRYRHISHNILVKHVICWYETIQWKNPLLLPLGRGD